MIAVSSGSTVRRAGFLALAMSWLCASGVVQAAEIGIDLTDPDSKNTPYPGSTTYYKEYNYSAGSLTLQVTGWSYQSGAIIQDWVGLWDGLGDERADAPNHAIDNASSDFDMLLLAFSAPVKLAELQLGWTYNDSDVSLLALTSGTPSSFTGKVWQTLLGEGWVSAGDYYDVKQNPDVNPNDIAAKYWLVGAYNANLGGDFLGDNHNVTTGSDYFKLKCVEFCAVPEPSTAAAVGLALCTLLPVLRRRR